MCNPDAEAVAESRTAEEKLFLERLLSGRSLDVWLRSDPDGTPWLCVSLDFLRPHSNVIERTLRLDFDGGSVSGGWSPACLNWDDGVRAVDAGIDLAEPEGICLTGSVIELARAAGRWFDDHLARFDRRTR